MSSHESDNGEFGAEQSCGTEAQRKFYTHILYAGLLVSRWITTGCELPFTSVPPTPLSASNKKSLSTDLDLARTKIERKVKIEDTL